MRIFVEEAGPETLKVVGATSVRLGGILETVQWLAEAGADAVLAIPPHFIPLSAEERSGALRAIAQACPSLGIVHYNTNYAPEVKFEPCPNMRNPAGRAQPLGHEAGAVDTRILGRAARALRFPEAPQPG